MTTWTTQPVNSLDDPRLAAFAHLTEVDLRRRWEQEHGLFIAEGHLVIERAVQSGLGLESVLTSPRWLDRLGDILGAWCGDVLVADEEMLKRISGFHVHRGALAAVRRPPLVPVASLLEGEGPILVLEELVDATNVGLAIRSAVGLGIEAVLLSPGCADPFYRRAVKSSMGAVLQARWARSESWTDDLRSLTAVRDLVVLTPAGELLIDEVLANLHPERVALLLGSEGPGASPAALRATARHARIPMHSGVDSLNVAAATAVACFALDQARRSS